MGRAGSSNSSLKLCFKRRECGHPKYFQELERELAEKRCVCEGSARMLPGLHPLGVLGGNSGLQRVWKVGRIVQ